MRHRLTGSGPIAAPIAVSAVTLAAALAVCTPALAQDTGFYVAGDLAWSQPSDWEPAPCGASPSCNFEVGDGSAVILRAGWRAAPNIRIEGEFARREADIDSLTVMGVTNPTPGYSTDSSAVMVNALYEFGSGRVRPFAGGGLGWSWGEVKGGGGAFEHDGFAWQLQAGVAVEISPRLNLDVTYRRFSIPDLTVEDSGVFEGDFTDHAISVGLRYSFGGGQPRP